MDVPITLYPAQMSTYEYGYCCSYFLRWIVNVLTYWECTIQLFNIKLYTFPPILVAIIGYAQLMTRTIASCICTSDQR